MATPTPSRSACRQSASKTVRRLHISIWILIGSSLDGQLQEWYDIFARQLRVAARSDLVRVVWCGDDEVDAYRQIKWHSTIGDALPLMLWVDNDKVYPPAAERTQLRSQGCVFLIICFANAANDTVQDLLGAHIQGLSAADAR